MVIHGLQKLTLLDYPGHTACTVFTAHCPWRCPFCHNASLVLEPESQPVIPRGCAEAPAGTLSGGNQQKVIIAREVTNDKDLLIAVNPTRGLDVGAIEFVHKYLVEQRNKNRAVLLVSFELDEIMSLSDRIEVIFDGQITGSVPGKDADEKELGFMMAGGKTDE